MSKQKWKPQISDVKQSEAKAKKDILYKAFFNLNRNIIGRMADRQGTYAIIGWDLVLVSKKYIWGNIVSCHKAVVHFAFKHHLRLIMYIRDTKHYYEFRPLRIIQYGIPNMRGDAMFLNFSIREGKRFG